MERFQTRESTPMTSATKPFTCIDDDIIENMAEIGVYEFAVYAAIKKHRNRETGA
jgi:hypothetical protein